jgi:hypothetical protein
MNARTRHARRTLAQRSADTRFHASLKRGRALATHAIAAGIASENVPGFVNGLRTTAKRLGVTPVKITRTRNTVDGKGGRKARLMVVHHYTADQVQIINRAYKPRKAAYVQARLALAA